MHSVCRCSLPVWRRSFLKKGTPCDLFWPRPGSAPGGIWPKNNNTCKGPWVLHPYQVSSKSIQRFWRRSRKCEKFTDGQTDDDDGRTDDGRCAMTIAHSSLRLRWAKNSCWNKQIHEACTYKESAVGHEIADIFHLDLEIKILHQQQTKSSYSLHVLQNGSEASKENF